MKLKVKCECHKSIVPQVIGIAVFIVLGFLFATMMNTLLINA
jgi:hypothetical protein